MPEREPELELALPKPVTPQPRRRRIAGLTPGQLLLAFGSVAALIWGIWATHAIVVRKEQQDIVSVRLSSIVGEYVQAQARSAAPPARVEAEMQRFMATLEDRVQERGAKGQIVLVGEAVLSRNVPDITEDVRRAVYATGIRMPERAPEAMPAPPAPEVQGASPFDGVGLPGGGGPANADAAN